MNETGHALSGIKRRIEKSLRLARDNRGNPHLAKSAQAMAERLMKKHGFTIEDFDLTGHPEFPGKNVDFQWVEGKGKIPFSIRVLSVIVSDIFPAVEILATSFISKNIRLSFACPKPKSPERALALFLRLQEELEAEWQKHERRCKEMNSNPLSRLIMGGNTRRVYFSSERSFYGGVLNGMQDRLPMERAGVKRLEDREQQAKTVRALLQAPVVEPFVPPPHNPLALMVINKKVPVDKEKISNDERRLDKFIHDLESEDLPTEAPPAYEDPEDKDPDESEFSHTEGYAVGVSIKLIRSTHETYH